MITYTQSPRTACLRWLSLAVSVAALSAQPPAAADGVVPDWEAAEILKQLAVSLKKVVPVLNAFKPGEWTAQGASETYIAQLATARSEIEFLAAAMEDLSAKPSHLGPAVKIVTRMSLQDRRLASLCEGVRRYQNAALAELLVGIQNEQADRRDRFLRFVEDLAEIREQECRIMDAEAQRCRAAGASSGRKR